MSDVLARWNALALDQAVREILPCCGSKAWAHRMAKRRPILDEATLRTASDQVWRDLAEPDWMEAFRTHPRIGDSRTPASIPLASAAWSNEEQEKVGRASEDIKATLAEGNRAYEERFKRTFIVCATGKTAAEVLDILGQRLRNDEATELHEAAEQQRQITQIRLRKWLST